MKKKPIFLYTIKEYPSVLKIKGYITDMRVVSTINNKSDISIITYNEKGLKIYENIKGIYEKKYEYNDNDKLIRTISDNWECLYEYDQNGNEKYFKRITLHSGEIFESRIEYSPDERYIKCTSTDGCYSKRYNKFRNIMIFEDNNHKYIIKYNKKGLETSYTSGDYIAFSEYDDNGLLLKISDNVGQKCEFKYNDNGLEIYRKIIYSALDINGNSILKSYERWTEYDEYFLETKCIELNDGTMTEYIFSYDKHSHIDKSLYKNPIIKK